MDTVKEGHRRTATTLWPQWIINFYKSSPPPLLSKCHFFPDLSQNVPGVASIPNYTDEEACLIMAFGSLWAGRGEKHKYS